MCITGLTNWLNESTEISSVFLHKLYRCSPIEICSATTARYFVCFFHSLTLCIHVSVSKFNTSARSRLFANINKRSTTAWKLQVIRKLRRVFTRKAHLRVYWCDLHNKVPANVFFLWIFHFHILEEGDDIWNSIYTSCVLTICLH